MASATCCSARIRPEHRGPDTMFKKIVLTPLAILLIALTPLYTNASRDQIQGKEQELEQLRRALAEKRAAKEKLAGQEKSVLADIKNLEERIDLAEKLLDKLKNKKEACQRDVKTLQARLQAAQQRAAAGQEILAERMRQLYMHGRLKELEVYLAAESLPDLARRVHLHRRVAEQDQQLIRQARLDQKAIAEDKAALEKQIQETSRLETEKKREELHLKKEKVGRSKLLEEVKDKKAAYEQAIREMEESARQIQAIIDRLEREQKEAPPSQVGQPEFTLPAGPFLDFKGKLPWPVQGTVVRKFGQQMHPKYKTVTFNNGIDIKAPYGAEIRAVFAGKVLYAGWLRGYGKFLILSHQKGFYTLYANASELLVEEGDLVQAGEVIAQVGETGSLDGPKLHFEVRHIKDQLNPLEWLK